MTPEKAIEIYCDDCQHRHLSEVSIRHGLIILRHFADYCRLHDLGDLRDAVPETLNDFFRWIKLRKRRDGEALSVKHINRHGRLVKTLFKFLAERHLVMTDIGKTFPPLHDPKTLPRGILDKDQAMQLLQQPHITTPLGFRDRTMFEVLYSTGLRGGELCRLSLYDFDPQERMIRVLGKGNKERIVPVGKVAAGYLGEYIKTVRPVLTGENQLSTIFLSATGRKLRPGDLHRILKAYREKAHLPDNITTHSLRHTCATEMLKGGASIRHVQELLGHADIQTTQIYTHVVVTDLKKAHARTAPSERRKTADKIEFTPGAGKVHWNDKRNAKFWPKLRARHRQKC
jgi:integrase/recombinase XerD